MTSWLGTGKSLIFFYSASFHHGTNHTFLPLSSIQVGKGVDQRQHSSLRISLVFTTEKRCSSGLCRWFRFPDSAVGPPHLHLHHAGSPREGGGGKIKRINQTNLEYKNYTAKREGNNRGGEEMEMSSLNISTWPIKRLGGRYSVRVMIDMRNHWVSIRTTSPFTLFPGHFLYTFSEPKHHTKTHRKYLHKKFNK